MKPEMPKPDPLADKAIGCLMLVAVVGLTLLVLAMILSVSR